MIIMALDHTRDNVHIGAYLGDPLNLETTTPILFFTRWITHFCAPVFVFLSGTSIFLQGLRKTKKELSGFLFKRGLWLIVVEVVLMSFAITFDAHYGLIVLQVIWAIGISMVLLGLLIRAPLPVLAAIGALLVFGHSALDFWERRHSGAYSVPYLFIHRPGIVPLSATHQLGIFYPFLPWTGVMLLGYCFGSIYRQTDVVKRNKTIAAMGIGLIFLFILLRYTNAYGDPFPWAKQKSALYTALSFINVQKYPPSLLYLCMTIGPALLFLGIIDSVQNRLIKIITVYGRVPFFYYILHFYMLHCITAGLFLARGHSWAEGAKGIAGFPFKFIIPGEGVSLAATYFIWLAVVIFLYPLCKWFGNYKQRHRQWWLSYL